MSTESNKAVVRRNFEELWNGRNWDVADEIYADDSVSRGIGGDRPAGPAGFKQFAQGTLALFPDLHITIENMIAEGDQVATVCLVTGTYQGGSLDLPVSAVGKKSTVRSITVNRLRDGKIVEGTNIMNQLEQLRQLGVLP